MKALLELASLFQVIPKPCRLPGQEAERAEEMEDSLLSAFLKPWSNVLQHPRWPLRAVRMQYTQYQQQVKSISPACRLGPSTARGIIDDRDRVVRSVCRRW